MVQGQVVTRTAGTRPLATRGRLDWEDARTTMNDGGVGVMFDGSGGSNLQPTTSLQTKPP